MKLWIKNMVEKLKKREIQENIRNIRFVLLILTLILLVFYVPFFTFFKNNFVGNVFFIIKHTLSLGIAICFIIDFIMNIILKDHKSFIISNLICSILWTLIFFVL